MRKRLCAVGDGVGVVIDKLILEQLDIDENTEIEVRADGDRVILEPVRSSDHQRRVTAATRRAVAVHGELLKKLAE